MGYKTWLLSLGCLILSCVFVSACPPESLISPCRCDHSSLVCENVMGQDVLDEVFRRLGNVKIEEFILKNSRVNYIPASAVEKHSFSRIRLIKSLLLDLFDRLPSTNNDLSHFSLESAIFRKGISLELLKPLKQLAVFFVKDTVVSKLNSDFRKNLDEVIRTVSLVETEKTSVNYGFIRIPNSEVLRVINSSITDLNRESFPFPSSRLHGIIFDGNNIETLTDDQFTLMKELRQLSLADNRITEVSERVFGPVYDQLKTLILERNPIKCDCSIKWITSRQSNSKYFTGKCAEPHHLVGKDIKDLKCTDFPDCP